MPKNNQKIDSLFDLITKFTNKRIYINEYILPEIMKDQYYDDLKDRIDVWEFGQSYDETITQVYQGLLRQTHVLISIKSNVEWQYQTVLPLWLKCKLPEQSLYFSKQNIAVSGSGYMFRKGFQWQEQFDRVQHVSN